MAREMRTPGRQACTPCIPSPFNNEKYKKTILEAPLPGQAAETARDVTLDDLDISFGIYFLTKFPRGTKYLFRIMDFFLLPHPLFPPFFCFSPKKQGWCLTATNVKLFARLCLRHCLLSSVAHNNLYNINNPCQEKTSMTT